MAFQTKISFKESEYQINDLITKKSRRQVFVEEAKRFKEENNIDFFTETSAKSGENSTRVFIEAAKNLHYDYLNNPASDRSGSMSRKNSSQMKVDMNRKISAMGQKRKDSEREEESSSGKCEIF